MVVWQLRQIVALGSVIIPRVQHTSISSFVDENVNPSNTWSNSGLSLRFQAAPIHTLEDPLDFCPSKAGLTWLTDVKSLPPLKWYLAAWAITATSGQPPVLWTIMLKPEPRLIVMFSMDTSLLKASII
jgi:hypothetical protein